MPERRIESEKKSSSKTNSKITSLKNETKFLKKEFSSEMKKKSKIKTSQDFKKEDEIFQNNVSFFENFLVTKGHLGSQKWTKDMADSLVGIRHGMSVFDAEKTKIACSRVVNFLKTFQKNQSNSKLDILFVNTSEQYRHFIKKVAQISRQRYINEKWVGGTLTNWSQISQSYSLFGRFHLLFGNFLKKRKIHLPLYEKARRIYSGLLPRKTRKKNIHLNSQFLSLENMGEYQTVFSDGLPDIVFLINPEENQNVLHEANLLKIPVIALADSQTKIQGIDYMIPGNVQSMEFVYWCLNLITITLQKRNKRKKRKPINLNF